MKREQGFTLIEVMIVVAIIAILCSIAYPSYVEHVRKTRLAQAKEGAMEIVTQLERRVSQKSAYDADLSALTQPYSGEVSYTYSRPDERNFVLQATNATYNVWVGINGKGTRCAYAAKDGGSGLSLSATATSCSSGSAF